MKRILLRSRKDPFRIVHAGAAIEENIFGNNVGNLIFSQASHKTLETSGTEVVANGFRAEASEAARINDEYDAFVIPLANAFRTSFVPHLNKLSALIEKLTIPVVVVGVGAQSDLDYGMDRMEALNKPVQRFVSAVLDRSASIGVRGEFTEKYLRGLGFNDVEVIGCPSMFMDGDRLTARYLTSGRLAADGVLRARLRPEAGPQGGTRIAGRMRWGNLGVFVSLYLACAAAVGAMAVFYANGVIGLVTLAPLGMAALYAGTALRSRGRDARELELRLRRVLQG